MNIAQRSIGGIMAVVLLECAGGADDYPEGTQYLPDGFLDAEIIDMTSLDECSGPMSVREFSRRVTENSLDFCGAWMQPLDYEGEPIAGEFFLECDYTKVDVRFDFSYYDRRGLTKLEATRLDDYAKIANNDLGAFTMSDVEDQERREAKKVRRRDRSEWTENLLRTHEEAEKEVWSRIEACDPRPYSEKHMEVQIKDEDMAAIIDSFEKLRKRWFDQYSKASDVAYSRCPVSRSEFDGEMEELSALLSEFEELAVRCERERNDSP